MKSVLTSHRPIFIALNSIVIVIALLGFIFLAMSQLPSSEYTPEEIQQKLATFTNPDQLRGLITHSDSYIRSLEDIVAQLAQVLKWFLLLSGTCAGFNLALLFFPRPKSKLPSTD